MIGKCKAIAHGSTALNYIFREGQLGYRLAFHNLCSREPKTIYEEMKMVSDYNTRCKNKFLCIEIGIAPQDEKKLPVSELMGIAHLFAKRMGLDNHQWVAVTHKDTDNRHIHIITNRISLYGEVYDTTFVSNRAAKVAKEISREFGYRSLKKNFEPTNNEELKKLHHTTQEPTERKEQHAAGYQLVSPSCSSISRDNDTPRAQNPIGAVADTIVSAADEVVEGLGDLITPSTQGNDYAETAWQRKLRNQANRKKKRGRGL